MIIWTPIAQLPDELKDGRQIGLAYEYANGTVNAGPPHYLYVFGRWHAGGWYLDDTDVETGSITHEPTHFAEITPP